MKNHYLLAVSFAVGLIAQTAAGQTPYGSAFERYSNYWNQQQAYRANYPTAYTGWQPNNGYASQYPYPRTVNTTGVPANWQRWSPNQGGYQARYGTPYGNSGYGAPYGNGAYSPSGYPSVPANYAPTLVPQAQGHFPGSGCQGGGCQHGGGGRCGTPMYPYDQIPYQGTSTTGYGYGSGQVPSNYYVDDDLWGQSKLFAKDQPVRNSLRFLFP